jgi:hypothetical protein
LAAIQKQKADAETLKQASEAKAKLEAETN